MKKQFNLLKSNQKEILAKFKLFISLEWETKYKKMCVTCKATLTLAHLITARLQGTIASMTFVKEDKTGGKYTDNSVAFPCRKQQTFISSQLLDLFSMTPKRARYASMVCVFRCVELLKTALTTYYMYIAYRVQDTSKLLDQSLEKRKKS